MADEPYIGRTNPYKRSNPNSLHNIKKRGATTAGDVNLNLPEPDDYITPSQRLTIDSFKSPGDEYDVPYEGYAEKGEMLQAPNLTPALPSSTVHPTANQPIRVGQYSGKLIGSVPIFAYSHAINPTMISDRIGRLQQAARQKKIYEQTMKARKKKAAKAAAMELFDYELDETAVQYQNEFTEDTTKEIDMAISKALSSDMSEPARKMYINNVVRDINNRASLIKRTVSKVEELNKQRLEKNLTIVPEGLQMMSDVVTGEMTHEEIVSNNVFSKLDQYESLGNAIADHKEMIKSRVRTDISEILEKQDGEETGRTIKFKDVKKRFEEHHVEEVAEIIKSDYYPNGLPEHISEEKLKNAIRLAADEEITDSQEIQGTKDKKDEFNWSFGGHGGRDSAGWYNNYEFKMNVPVGVSQGGWYTGLYAGDVIAGESAEVTAPKWLDIRRGDVDTHINNNDKIINVDDMERGLGTDAKKVRIYVDGMGTLGIYNEGAEGTGKAAKAAEKAGEGYEFEGLGGYPVPNEFAESHSDQYDFKAMASATAIYKDGETEVRKKVLVPIELIEGTLVDKLGEETVSQAYYYTQEVNREVKGDPIGNQQEDTPPKSESGEEGEMPESEKDSEGVKESDLPLVVTEEDYKSLESGQQYIDENDNIRTKK